MGTGVSTIVKGRILRLIDQRLQHPRTEFLQELESGQGLSGIARSLGYIDAGAGTHHADVEMLGNHDGESWWPDQQAKAAKIRAAYIQALRLALEYTPPKPVVTYWIREGPRFETMVADSQREVHVFWLTPEAPAPAPPAAGNEFREDLWLVSTPERIQQIRAPLQQYQVEEPFELPKANGVQCFRIIGY